MIYEVTYCKRLCNCQLLFEICQNVDRLCCWTCQFDWKWYSNGCGTEKDVDSGNITNWGWTAYSLLSSQCVELSSFPSTSGHHSVFQKLVWVTAKKNRHYCYFASRIPATLIHNFLFMKYCFGTDGFEAWKYSHMCCWLHLLHPHFYHQNLVPYYCASLLIYSTKRLWNHVLLVGATTLHQTTLPQKITLFSCAE